MIGRAFSSQAGEDLVEEDKAVSLARQKAYYSGTDPDEAAKKARADLSAKRSIRAKSTGKPSDPPTPAMSTSRKPTLKKRGSWLLGQSIDEAAAETTITTATKESSVRQLLRLLGISSVKVDEAEKCFAEAVNETVTEMRRKLKHKPVSPDQGMLFNTSDTDNEIDSILTSVIEELAEEERTNPQRVPGVPREIQLALSTVHSGEGFNVSRVNMADLQQMETLKGKARNRPFSAVLTTSVVSLGVSGAVISTDKNGMLCAMAIKTSDASVADIICRSVNANGGWLVTKVLGHPEWSFLSSE